jgi:hypothetical protein
MPGSSESIPSFIGTSDDSSVIDNLVSNIMPDGSNNSAVDAEFSKIGFDPLVGLMNSHLLKLDVGEVVEGLEDDVRVSLLESEHVEQFVRPSILPHVSDISL